MITGTVNPCSPYCGRVLPQILQGILPSLVLKIFLAILPPVLDLLHRYTGLVSVSQVDFATVDKYFIFQVWVLGDSSRRAQDHRLCAVQDFSHTSLSSQEGSHGQRLMDVRRTRTVTSPNPPLPCAGESHPATVTPLWPAPPAL